MSVLALNWKYHYIYLITNIITNKKYIGVHSTNNLNDGYMGSSKSLKKDIKLLGKQNFVKEILETFPSRELAEGREKQLVTKKEVMSDVYYNNTVGGLFNKSNMYFHMDSEEYSQWCSKNAKKSHLNRTKEDYLRIGKLSAETKKKKGCKPSWRSEEHTSELQSH